MLQHPIIEVAIGGTVVDTRASEFRLMTQSGFHSVVSRLAYPADAEAGASGDDITVSLASGDKTDLYFSGTVYSVNVRGPYRELLLTDSYKKLCDTNFTAAYRKEKAAAILEDILGAAGIRETAITIPGVELARFSTQTVPARICIDLLIAALKEHGAEGLTYFFDEKNVFHFGTPDDTGKNEGEDFAFETGKDILRAGRGWIELLPRPIRHTQRVTVDGRELLSVRTDLRLSRGSSRIIVYLKGAA
jgi:hypothetical protein